MDTPITKIKITHKDAVIPAYKTSGSNAFDVQVMIDSGRCCDTIMPGQPMKYGTGIAVQVPEGYVGILTIRSGKSSKDGLKLSNAIGIIDSDYRGEIFMSLWTERPNGCKISHGERVAQLLIMPCPQSILKVVDELDETDRGSGGFGSTGK